MLSIQFSVTRIRRPAGDGLSPTQKGVAESKVVAEATSQGMDLGLERPLAMGCRLVYIADTEKHQKWTIHSFEAGTEC